VALLLSSAWALVRPHAAAGKRGRAICIVAMALVLHQLAGASALVVLIVAAVMGAVWDGSST
jgi:hypothetical protein